MFTAVSWGSGVQRSWCVVSWVAAGCGEKPPEVSRPLRTVDNVLLVVKLDGGLTNVHLIIMCHNPYILTIILYFQTFHH